MGEMLVVVAAAAAVIVLSATMGVGMGGMLAVTAVSVVGVVVYATIRYYGTLPVPEEIPKRLHRRLRIITAIGNAMAFIQRHAPGCVFAWLLRLPTITPVPDFDVTETTLDDVPVIIYRPMNSGSRPLSAVIWIHGGGWVFGSVYTSHGAVSKMATTLENSVIISVGYRLAPMSIFPAAIDDVTKATVWVLRHLDELNIDPERIVVMGESAGGNLAAALSQRLTFDPQYKDLPKLRAQVLHVPCLQMFDFKTPSCRKYGHFSTLVVSSIGMARSWNIYLSGDTKLASKMMENQHISAAAKNSSHSQLVFHDLIPEEFRNSVDSGIDSAPGDDNIYSEIADTMLDPDFAPLMRPLLTGLPEAYIVTAGYDILRDDGILYAKRLEADGVKTTWKHYADDMHGHFSMGLVHPASAEGSVVQDTFSYLKHMFK